MKIVFHEQAWDDYLYWQKHDRKLSARLNSLLKEFMRTPFEGTGKAEPLKGQLSGWWSRRLNREHRLVYRIRGVPGTSYLIDSSAVLSYAFPVTGKRTKGTRSAFLRKSVMSPWCTKRLPS